MKYVGWMKFGCLDDTFLDEVFRMDEIGIYGWQVFG